MRWHPLHLSRRASLRLPGGCLSPLAFQPVPSSGAAAPAVAGSGDSQLFLPSDERPITFSLLWEQPVDEGEDGIYRVFSDWVCPAALSSFLVAHFPPTGCAPAAAASLQASPAS